MIYYSLKKPFISTLVIMGLFSIELPAQKTDFHDISFAKADSVAGVFRNHDITNLKELSDKLTKPMSTDVEKFRAIYKWVCDNIENDYSLYLMNKNKREKLQGNPEKLNEWNREFNPKVLRKLIREHKTVCTGYAYLVKELAYHAGINCEIVDGYGRTAEANIGGEGVANHSWNAVQLNNQWYLCDATWSSGSIDAQQGSFIRQFSDAYFLASPSLFVRNHYPLDTSKIFLKQKPVLREFLDGPLVYKNAFSYEVLPTFPETFQVKAKRGEIIAFRFSSKNDLAGNKAELRIVKAGATESFFPKMSLHSYGLYEVDHKFDGRGTYVVHLLLNGEHLFSYKITVLK